MQQMIGELAPAELPQKRGRTRRQARITLPGEIDRVPALLRAQLAEMQMRREHGRAWPVRPIASCGIAGKRFINQRAEPFRGTNLTRTPGRAEAARPIGLARQQLQVIDAVAPRPALRNYQMPRRRTRAPKAIGGEQCPPERGKDAERLATPVAQVLRLHQQRSAEAAHLDPGLFLQPR